MLLLYGGIWKSKGRTVYIWIMSLGTLFSDTSKLYALRWMALPWGLLTCFIKDAPGKIHGAECTLSGKGNNIRETQAECKYWPLSLNSSYSNLTTPWCDRVCGRTCLALWLQQQLDGIHFSCDLSNLLLEHVYWLRKNKAYWVRYYSALVYDVP